MTASARRQGPRETSAPRRGWETLRQSLRSSDTPGPHTSRRCALFRRATPTGAVVRPRSHTPVRGREAEPRVPDLHSRDLSPAGRDLTATALDGLSSAVNRGHLVEGGTTLPARVAPSGVTTLRAVHPRKRGARRGAENERPANDDSYVNLRGVEAPSPPRAFLSVHLRSSGDAGRWSGVRRDGSHVCAGASGGPGRRDRVCCAPPATCGGRSRRVLDPTVRDPGISPGATPFPRRRDEPPTFVDRVRARPHPEVRSRCGEASGRLVLPSPRACLARSRSPAVAPRSSLSSRNDPREHDLARLSSSPSPRHHRHGGREPFLRRAAQIGAEARRSLPTGPPHALSRAARRFPSSPYVRRRDGRGTDRAPHCHHHAPGIVRCWTADMPSRRGDGRGRRTRHVR